MFFNMDVPIIMCNELSQLDLPHIVKGGLKTGFMNLANLSLTQIPEKLLEVFPRPPELNLNDATDCNSENENKDGEDINKQSCYGSKSDVVKFLVKDVSLDNINRNDYLNITRLNLSSNAFTCIPVIICSLTNLQVLDFQDNKLTILPHEIGLLHNLNRLVLSHNQITELNNEVFDLKNLRYLFLQDNKITKLEPEVARLNLLEFMDISQNYLEEIPAEFGYLRRLVRCNFAENRLGVLPEEIGRLETIQILDLTHNYLVFLPSKLGELRTLEQLSVRRNQLVEFPSLLLCGNLKELHLGGNSICEIPKDKLYPLVSLRVLELRENKLQNIPDEISVLAFLVRLDLSSNTLEDLPNTLGLMLNLKALSIDGNPLDHIKKKMILQRGTEEILEYLRNRLNSKNPVVKPPPEPVESKRTPNNINKDIHSCNALTVEDKQMLQHNKTLNFCRRYAKEIPEEVFSCAMPCRIHTMRLSSNRLTEVPVRIKDFLHLMNEIDLSYNLLPEIPSFLGYATHLRVLDIQDNQLFTLPTELGLLRHLQKLNISKNKFYQIPDIIYDMCWLEILFAGSNMISELNADGLLHLTELQVLDVSNNNIKSIPYKLGYMTQLRRLQLSGNPFRQPRPNILARGTAYVMDWLRDRIPIQAKNN